LRGYAFIRTSQLAFLLNLGGRGAGVQFLKNMIFGEVEQRAQAESSLRRLSGDLFRETMHTLSLIWLLVNKPPPRQALTYCKEKFA
jgi:hypothetical protein